MRYHVVLIFGALTLALTAAGCSKDGNAACDLDAPDCPSSQVCLTNESGSGGICTDQCDPLTANPCSGGDACDPVQGGGFACFAPVFIEGTIFDIDDESPIANATVLGADATGVVVTSVAETGLTGTYRLQVPVERDRNGDPVSGSYTLRVAAQDYLPFPSGIRVAIPIAVTVSVAAGSGALFDEATGQWTVINATTSVALIDAGAAGLASVSGTVAGDLPGGTLVVAECTRASEYDAPCPFAYAGRSGRYVIFNVPAGSYQVRGYKGGHQFAPQDLTVTDANVTLDLPVSSQPLATLTGSVQIVSAPGSARTSVVLVPTSTYQQLSETFLRGEIAPGLRAPGPGIAPNLSSGGTYTIEGVPEGTYKVLAGFENDDLVRDPNPGTAGTVVVEVTVPDAVDGVDINFPSQFKVTSAIPMVGPGRDGPEAVVAGAPLVLAWASYPQTDEFLVAVFDAYGDEVWSSTAPKGTPMVTYEGPLEVGMYYQWQVVSYNTGGDPISSTEDLRGVFYVVEP